jgi:hypothetical protein
MSAYSEVGRRFVQSKSSALARMRRRWVVVAVRRRGGTKVPNADLRAIAEHTAGLSTFLNIRHRTLDPNDGNVSAD